MATAAQPQPSHLEDQAAAAALHANRSADDYDAMGEDQKLSAAGAAASLKYANPKDLPSYPVLGLSNSDLSASSAAHLANANRKSFEHWKPSESASASKAAFLAKDYKPPQIWQPEMSSAGSRAALLAKDYKPPEIWQPEMSSAGSRAALLAHKEGANVNIWKPETSQSGNTAAGLAMRNTKLTPQLDYGYTPEGTRRAMLAASGAMSGTRRRSGSTPVNLNSSNSYAANSAASAYNAASKPAIPSRLNDSSPALDASRILHVAKNNVNRELYTSSPPVSVEVDEKKRQDVLRAAAVSMAKQLYDIQQSRNSDAWSDSQTPSQQAAARVHQRSPSNASGSDIVTSGAQYVNLQEAAQRLAAERLAKMNVEHDSYKDYYGMQVPAARGSLRGRGRRRASSDTTSMFDDEEQSRRIRSEMSLFNNKLAEVDAQKRQRDREALLAAAQRNVTASMHGMDERVYAETGKASEALMEEWEAKARAKAEADSKVRMANHGKIDIGGGKFLDQADIDAVALANIQPTLNDINERAEALRAKQEELRLDEEQKKREAQLEKERQQGLKAEERRIKDEEKRLERQRKEEEKAKRAEEKRKEKDERRKSKEMRKKEAETVPARDTEDRPSTSAEAEPLGSDAAVEIAERATAPEVVDNPSEVAAGVDQALETAGLDTADATESHEPAAEMETTEEMTQSGTKSDSRVRSWLKGRFSRRLSRSQKAEGEGTEENRKSFVGGAALTGASVSNASLDRRADSDREVAMAGRESDVSDRHDDSTEIPEQRGREASPSISSLSSEEESRGRTGRRASSSSRDEFEEARDQFDEGLAPPPTFATSGRSSDSPARDSKFQEDFE